MAAMEDFEVGQYVGRRRDDAVGGGDVIRVLHRRTGETQAMKRVDVDPARAHEMLGDFTKSSTLRGHSAWLGLFAERSFVTTSVDAQKRKKARCCVVMELADRSLEAELVTRAVHNQPFDLMGCWATLLQAVQAFHAQGMLHRDVCPRNIFFTNDGVKLGPPALDCASATRAYYVGGRCSAYSADIFALGLVFLEMAVLQVFSDLVPGGPDAMLAELAGLGGGAAAVRSWLGEQCSLLGLELPSDAVMEILGAMLAAEPSARPTADDLLEWPLFATLVDPQQLLPVWERPCVVLAHEPGVAFREVPRREVLCLPRMHQLFSRRGAEFAVLAHRYHWCGEEHELWWVEPREPLLRDRTVAASLAREPPELGAAPAGPEELPPLTAAAAYSLAASQGPAALDTLLLAAARHREAASLLVAEIFYRAALAVEGQGIAVADTWLGLASTLLERGNLMAAHRAYERARLHAAGEGMQEETKLFGLCELFKALELLQGYHSGELPEKVSPRGPPEDALDVAARSDGERWQDRPGAVEPPQDPSAALRAAHVMLYYRSTLAIESGDWEALAALGEFYRLAGCPEPPLRGGAAQPDVDTATSYFEQAHCIAPASPFVRDRLARLSATGAAAVN